MKPEEWTLDGLILWAIMAPAAGVLAVGYVLLALAAAPFVLLAHGIARMGRWLRR